MSEAVPKCVCPQCKIELKPQVYMVLEIIPNEVDRYIPLISPFTSWCPKCGGKFKIKTGCAPKRFLGNLKESRGDG